MSARNCVAAPAEGRTDFLRWRAFGLPKKGADASEYEDAVAASGTATLPPPAAGGPAFRVAVADGATESVFAGRWATMLAERFVQSGPRVLAEDLSEAQHAWADAVDADALPWYTAAKAADGAFATLLGVELRPGPGPPPPAGTPRPGEGHLGSAVGTWDATAVGDGNLFHLRGGTLLRAWPRTEAGQFDDRPALVPSRPAVDMPLAHNARGPSQSGDAFVLATDAVAAWLLRTEPARALDWHNADAFADAVRYARSEGLLKNDDSTVATISVE